jgi:hypothetical protein
MSGISVRLSCIVRSGNTVQNVEGDIHLDWYFRTKPTEYQKVTDVITTNQNIELLKKLNMIKPSNIANLLNMSNGSNIDDTYSSMELRDSLSNSQNSEFDYSQDNSRGFSNSSNEMSGMPIKLSSFNMNQHPEYVKMMEQIRTESGPNLPTNTTEGETLANRQKSGELQVIKSEDSNDSPFSLKEFNQLPINGYVDSYRGEGGEEYEEEETYEEDEDAIIPVEEKLMNYFINYVESNKKEVNQILQTSVTPFYNNPLLSTSEEDNEKTESLMDFVLDSKLILGFTTHDLREGLQLPRVHWKLMLSSVLNNNNLNLTSERAFPSVRMSKTKDSYSGGYKRFNVIPVVMLPFVLQDPLFVMCNQVEVVCFDTIKKLEQRINMSGCDDLMEKTVDCLFANTATVSANNRDMLMRYRSANRILEDSTQKVQVANQFFLELNGRLKDELKSSAKEIEELKDQLNSLKRKSVTQTKDEICRSSQPKRSATESKYKQRKSGSVTSFRIDSSKNKSTQRK